MTSDVTVHVWSRYEFWEFQKKSVSLKETRPLEVLGHFIQVMKISVWITIVCEPELEIKLLPSTLHFVPVIMPLTEA